ncbi:MAG: tRNA (guanosine(37)-N1)-methyltransferase TrmD [Eubacteriales bacterium]|nr:tRNA (guanosine(37)-N1)-methyltransferase TrmD [Eubacteriales bacterium]
MNFYVMTLFPQMVLDALSQSITGRAIAKGLIGVEAIDIRDYTTEKHGKTDDYPYGGGAGMVMQVQPVYDCYKAVMEKIGAEHPAAPEPGQVQASAENAGAAKRPRVLYMSPQGRTFDQSFARELANEEELIFLCGHYEGIDERALELLKVEEVSLGDFVLTGGELPAITMIDCISRLIPGVLGGSDSAEIESFHDNLLEYPQYSRPEEFMGLKVPEILLSGHHANVDKWRREQSIIRTLNKRPDLIEKAVLNKKEKKFLDGLLEQKKIQ